MDINTSLLLILLFLCHNYNSSGSSNNEKNREIVEIKSDNDVVWIVKLYDLHFSVHHPERASDFQKFVGSTLSVIDPSLILFTGDLTDGKSKDLLTMKQNVEEWVEYQKTMEDVIKRSGLDKSIFYDLRGNHDHFGVPASGGPFDFFSKYSITGQLERSQSVNSVTLQIPLSAIEDDIIRALANHLLDRGWQDIANHLLDRLKDEDDIIRALATKLLTLIDPSFVLPGLVHLIYYSSDATLHLSAASTLLELLTYHNQKPEVVSMVLDYLRNPNASSDLQNAATSYKLEGLQGDADRVLKLIPRWSKSVSFNTDIL